MFLLLTVNVLWCHLYFFSLLVTVLSRVQNCLSKIYLLNLAALWFLNMTWQWFAPNRFTSTTVSLATRRNLYEQCFEWVFQIQKLKLKKAIFILFYCSLANHLAYMCHDFKVKLATYMHTFLVTQKLRAPNWCIHLTMYPGKIFKIQSRPPCRCTLAAKLPALGTGGSNTVLSSCFPKQASLRCPGNCIKMNSTNFTY